MIGRLVDLRGDSGNRPEQIDPGVVSIGFMTLSPALRRSAAAPGLEKTAGPDESRISTAPVPDAASS